MSAVTDKYFCIPCRGCETWVVREGYEGLVRGNNAYYESTGKDKVTIESKISATALKDGIAKDPGNSNLLHNLRFGDGDLLRDGTSEFLGGRTLKGRYIVRVGFDDVRGWFSEVRSYLFF